MKMLPGMSDALRLVRAGDIKQAVAVIQRSLHGHAATAEERRPAATPIDAPRPSAARAPSAGARFESHSYANHAGMRQYKLYVPGAYQGQTLPLVVMLHGCTQSPDDFAAGTRMNELAAEHGFLVAYPAQPGSANPNKCWNWFKRADQQRERGEPSLIAGIVGAVKSGYAIHERQVYIAGLSSGGAMAATLAATYPDVFAAVGVHSGLAHGCAYDLPTGLAAMRSGSAGVAIPSLPTIVFHGDRDTLVNPRNGEALVAQWLAASPDSELNVDSRNHANGYAYTRRTVRAASGHSEMEHWVIHGAGHAWSGGSSTGTHTDPRGPDASGEMVRFFLAQGGNPR